MIRVFLIFDQFLYLVLRKKKRSFNEKDYSIYCLIWCYGCVRWNLPWHMSYLFWWRKFDVWECCDRPCGHCFNGWLPESDMFQYPVHATLITYSEVWFYWFSYGKHWMFGLHTLNFMNYTRKPFTYGIWFKRF